MSTDVESIALTGREQEYDDVLCFIEERLSRAHWKSLFVFGACGCGKTSSVLRAMRRVTHRPMSCDRRSGGGSASALKRSRDSAQMPAAPPYPKAKSFPLLFGPAPRRVQGHYVNCADMTAHQLCEAIVASIRGAQPRPDAQTRGLIAQLEELPRRVASKRSGARAALASGSCGNNNNNNNDYHSAEAAEAAAAAAVVRRGAAAPPLHVLALDEVEYARAGAAPLLTELSALSVECAAQLALVFISNQRDLVHVPRGLLKDLPFEAYSAEALERIGADIVSKADFSQSEREMVQLSPGLISFIARKALLEHSGDVRQVASMCRRLVHTAQQEMAATKEETPPKRRRSGAGASGSPLSSPAAAAAVATGSPSPAGKTVTLAQSHKVLRGPAVGERVAEYVAGMPEQMLYVLSCLVVLNLRQQRDKERDRMAIAGTTSTSFSSSSSSSSSSASLCSHRRAAGSVGFSLSAAEPGTFTMRAVHSLYTALMGQQRFPSMNAGGIAGAIDGFADLGILSRPQRRGNEELFSFNGTWPLDAMQSALTARGEALRQERIECGLDASENRFGAVLRELKTILGL